MATRSRWSRSALVAVGLLALLALLATLQYRWLGQVSEAERMRLLHDARIRAEAFARDFDREITRAYLHLQVDSPTLRERSWQRYSARYEDWHARSPHPGLVAAVYLAEPAAAGEPRLSRFDRDARAFVPVDWPVSLDPLRQCLLAALPQPEEAHSLMPIAETIPALVSPIPEVLTVEDDKAAETSRAVVRLMARRDTRRQWPLTIVVLDREVLSRTLLPALAKRHLAGSDGPDGREYDFAVTSVRGGDRPLYASPGHDTLAVGDGDAATPLFELRLDDLDLSLLSTLLPEGAARRSQQLFAFHLAGPADVRVGSMIKRSPAPWRLVLMHRAGSIDAVVARTRRRSLAVGLGVLGVLGAGVVLILVSSQRARGLAARQMEFVAGVSHELRTPLAVIRSAAENLADGVVEDEAAIRRYGTVIRDEGRRLSAMVEQVLAYSSVDGGAGLDRRPVSMASLVSDVLARAEPSLREVGLELERQIDSDLPEIQGDASALSRAVANLVTNASVHAASGGWIGVRAVSGSGPGGLEVHVAVADRGPGVDAEDVPRLFEPFFRGRRAVQGQSPGSGLGLAVVRGIAVAHGGRASVRSVPGEGSTFTLHLPVRTDTDRRS